MNAPSATAERIAAALDPLPSGPLDEASVRAHVAPLFARVLEAGRTTVHLANHSLGRPLDATEDDVREALAAWYGRVNGAWTAWNAEIAAYRARLASLLGVARADAIVPRSSAGQGLRAVLNSHPPDARPRVVATRGEFDSLDLVLREYARRGRIALEFVEPDGDGFFDTDRIADAVVPGVDLLVVSPVLFHTGQVLADVPALVARAHVAGARVLLDVYHMLGVLPADLAALDADFAVGGSYKYLRGGPGACFLYVHPRLLDAGLRTLDTGWFAKDTPFDYTRPDPPRFAPGGDAWLESTPAVLPFYQARAGQLFTAAIGVGRLRTYSLAQQRRLVALLAERGIAARGGREDQGGFVTVRDPRARDWAGALGERGVSVDARGAWLRLGPDLLTTDAELVVAADRLAAVARGAAVGD